MEFTAAMQDAQARGKDPYRETGKGKERAERGRDVREKRRGESEEESDLDNDERFNA